jgi:hypothetical protein
MYIQNIVPHSHLARPIFIAIYCKDTTGCKEIKSEIFFISYFITKILGVSMFSRYFYSAYLSTVTGVKDLYSA